MFSVISQDLILLMVPLFFQMVKTHGREPEVVNRCGVLSICALYRFLGNERGATSW